MRHFVASGGYTFYVEENPLYDDDNDDIRIEFLSLKKQPYPCVRMIASKNPRQTSAELSALCSIKDKLLENHQGTIMMLKTALAYLLSRYPHIKRVELQDETFIDIPTRPFITSRRLLLGQRGWYEENLGARPSKKTRKLIRHLRQPVTQQAVQDILVKYAHTYDKKWWSAENTKRVADELNPALFQQLLGTTWVIPAETIRGWNVLFDVKDRQEMQAGGAQLAQPAEHRRLQRILKKAHSGYVNAHQVR